MFWRGSGVRAAGGLASALLLVLSLAGTALGQERLAAVPAIGGDGRAVAPPPTATPRVHDEGGPGSTPPVIDHRSILVDLPRLRLELRGPCYDPTGFLSECAQDEPIPGSSLTIYRGIHAVAVRRILGYYRQLFTDTIRDRWLGSRDSLFDLERRIRTFHEAEGDVSAGGRWWQRSWRQSLVPERGGAPDDPVTTTVGREIEVLRIGDLALTTEGKLRAGRLALYLDDDRIYERLQRTKDTLIASASPRARASDAALNRVGATDKDRDGRPDRLDKEKPGTPTPLSEEKRIDLAVDFMENDAQVELESILRGTSRQRLPRQVGRFETPRGNLLTGEGWNLNFRPNLQLRLPDGSDMVSAVSTAAVEFDLNLFPGETRQLWGVLNFRFTARPRYEEYSAIVTFEVVRW